LDQLSQVDFFRRACWMLCYRYSPMPRCPCSRWLTYGIFGHAHTLQAACAGQNMI
jgi:hypothetical protein